MTTFEFVCLKRSKFLVSSLPKIHIVYFIPATDISLATPM